MAGITHLGIGFAAKRFAPNLHLLILLTLSELLDLLFVFFMCLGLEHMPDSDVSSVPGYSHGLFMSLVWSTLAGLVAYYISRDKRTSLLVGLLVFSHWVVDFIAQPMTYVFPESTGLPIFFAGSPLVGLGLWNSELMVNLGEYVPLVVGMLVYAVTYYQLRITKNTQLDLEMEEKGREQSLT